MIAAPQIGAGMKSRHLVDPDLLGVFDTYAQRLMRHGVSVELHVYAGAYHGFDFLTNAPVAVAARRDSLSALRRFLHPRQAAA
jgi:acetyl esterase/lipase